MSVPDKMANEQPRPTVARRAARRASWIKISSSFIDEPSSGGAAWASTTAGVVWLLVALQMFTGALLAVYYVPSVESAHTTVTYIEKVAASGSWIRALHAHGSVWLPIALLLHLGQMLWRANYRRRAWAWVAAVALLALSLAGGATGYSLPWDTRAFYNTRIAAGIAGGLPLVGASAGSWLLGGTRVSTLTLSRFYALHVLLIPFLIVLTVASRLFISYLREISPRAGAADSTALTDALETALLEPRTSASKNQVSAQLARQSIVVLIVFAALAFVAARFPAPLGPPPAEVSSAYLPRPGLQFLWLFQLLKYLSGAAASLVALLLPGLLLVGLALVPFFDSASPPCRVPRRAAASVFVTLCALVVGLTALAYFADARDAVARDQLARQAAAEAEFRRAPFVPRRVQIGDEGENANGGTNDATNSSPLIANGQTPPPAAFTENCAKCHGARGEGKSINPRLIGVSAQPRRSVEDIIAILNNPASYGLESRMPTFADKLTDEEKRQLALWIVSL